jgi:hypothetical protein
LECGDLSPLSLECGDLSPLSVLCLFLLSLVSISVAKKQREDKEKREKAATSRRTPKKAKKAATSRRTPKTHFF